MVEPLVDAVGVLGSLEELFPDTPLEAWAPYRDRYPELFAGDSWRLHCTCHLVREAGQMVLFDTGVGPPGLWGWEAEWEGGLLPALAGLEVEPEDVDAVVLSHVHIDHIGWNTDAAGKPVFPRARYLLHEDALAAARERAGRPHIERCVLGIEDRLETFGHGDEVSPGITAVALPGHDRGHIGVRVEDGALLIADAAPHPAFLDHPEWRFDFDLDHERAARTRRELVDGIDGEVVYASHFPDGGLWHR